MFDFFKDIIQEAGGIDTIKAKNQREEQKEIEKLSRYIFSSKSKLIILILGVLYIMFAALTIAVSWNASNCIIPIAKCLTLSTFDIIACVALLKGTKKGEIVALISGLIFIVLLYASVYIR